MPCKRKNPKYWIQAIKRKGVLRAYVKRKYGKRGFTPRGTIKVEILKRLAEHGKGAIKKRAQLALTLRRLAKRK